MAKNNDVNPQYKNTCFLVGQAMLSMAVASPTCAESIMTLLNIDLIANKTYSADERNTMNKVCSCWSFRPSRYYSAQQANHAEGI